MNTVQRKRITIIAEAYLEDRLIREVKQFGAKGYTLSTVKGEGSRGVRASEWEGGNIKLETIVSEEVADRILTQMAEVYFPHFAVIAYVENVEVVRGNKYT
jgi:nitrogen regulatory protein PII